MKFFLQILPVLFLLTLSPPAHALSDEDHEFFLTRLDYASSDQMLNRAWKDLKRAVPEKTYPTLLKNQRSWILEKRDREVAAFKKIFPYLDDCSCYFLSNVARAFLLDTFTYGVNRRSLVSESSIYALFYSLEPSDFVAELLSNINIEALHPYNRGGKFRPPRAAPTRKPDPAISTVLQQILDNLNELRK